MKKFRIVLTVLLLAVVAARFLSLSPAFSKGTPHKKINAKLECRYEADDGTLFRYPGNGTREKPRLDGTLYCWVAVPSIPAGMTLAGTIRANGKPQEAEAIPRPDDTYSIDASFTADNGDFEVCAPFTVTGEVKSAGKSLWQGRLPIVQRCTD